MIFKKKKLYERFGREVESGHIATCDICDKKVRFNDFIYLCKECQSKLPEYAKENHHWLVADKKARKLYLEKAIEQLANKE